MQHHTPRLSEILAIVAGMGATGWLGWRHIGPYRWLSDAQAMLFDGSYWASVMRNTF